jgi:hypothetical protein
MWAADGLPGCVPNSFSWNGRRDAALRVELIVCARAKVDAALATAVGVEVERIWIGLYSSIFSMMFFLVAVLLIQLPRDTRFPT